MSMWVGCGDGGGCVALDIGWRPTCFRSRGCARVYGMTFVGSCERACLLRCCCPPEAPCGRFRHEWCVLVGMPFCDRSAGTGSCKDSVTSSAAVVRGFLAASEKSCRKPALFLFLFVFCRILGKSNSQVRAVPQFLSSCCNPKVNAFRRGRHASAGVLVSTI